MSPQYNSISEGKRQMRNEMHPTVKCTKVGMFKNVHSTRVQRETKGDGNQTSERRQGFTKTLK